MTSYHDIEHNGVKYIMELLLNDEGTSYIGLTEASKDPDSMEELSTYDFNES